MINKDYILDQVADAINKYDYIISARAYGSWFYNEKSVDLDIAVMNPCDSGGVVESKIYESLKNFRQELCGITNCDIDLVPHTMDEIDNINSSLWHPRYNPSLVLGKNIKGNFDIQPTYKNNRDVNFGDIAENILFDNRTICRRQLVRSFNPAEARIFVSKLLHGPGNTLTRYSFQNNLEYKCSPSDLFFCFKIFDQIYSVNSQSTIEFFNDCKEKITFSDGLKLMQWYECLMAVVLNGDGYLQNYQNICLSFADKK